MTSREQTNIIIQAMREELELRKRMSEKERKEAAKKNLQDIGVLDDKGKLNSVYSGVLVRAE